MKGLPSINYKSGSPINSTTQTFNNPRHLVFDATKSSEHDFLKTMSKMKNKVLSMPTYTHCVITWQLLPIVQLSVNGTGHHIHR